MAVPVGGTNGLIDRLLTLLKWAATSDTARAERKDALTFLDWAHKFICNREALLFLNYTWPVAVLQNATKIGLEVAPFDSVGFDYAKDHVLFDGNGFPLTGPMAFDQFHRVQASADRVFTGPSGYIVSIDKNDGKRYLMFDAPQPSNATFTLHGQRLASNLTDVDSSYSLLPDGDELVLLLPCAEQFAKQRRVTLDASVLDVQTRDALDAFYAKHRANKLTNATDTNSQRRSGEKAAQGQLGE